MFIRFPPHVQDVISQYRVLGFIPLDKLLHFFFGIVLTLLLRRFHLKMKTIFIVIGLVAVLKEVNDFYVLNSSITEQLLDILATFIYPLIVAGIMKIKSSDKSI